MSREVYERRPPGKNEKPLLRPPDNWKWKIEEACGSRFRVSAETAQSFREGMTQRNKCPWAWACSLGARGGHPGTLAIPRAFLPCWWWALYVPADIQTSQESVFFEDRLVPCFPEQGCSHSKVTFPGLGDSQLPGFYTHLSPHTRVWFPQVPMGYFMFQFGKHNVQSLRGGCLLFVKLSLVHLAGVLQGGVCSHRQTICG